MALCMLSYWNNMASTYLKDDSEMHCVWNMVRSQTTPLRHAAVELNNSLSITPWSAMAWVASQPFIIIRFMTSQRQFSLRSVMMLPLSLLFSHIVERMWLLTLQTLILTKTNVHKMFMWTYRYICVIADTFQNSHFNVQLQYTLSQFCCHVVACGVSQCLVTTQVCVVSQ